MTPEEKAEQKRALLRLGLGFLIVESFTWPAFRSGGRGGLSFWGWVKNHTIFGPPVEYVPQEDYAREFQGVYPWNPVTEPGAEATAAFALDGAISVVADEGRMPQYKGILANVRYDGKYHPIKSLVQPDDPLVRDIARVLVQSEDFIEAAQEFVNSFTTYEREEGDYWTTPGEILEKRAGDCDDKAILLCSILRNYIPADQVYCAFGLWLVDGETTGHMYVVTEGEDGEDRIIEATAGPGRKTRGKYVMHGIFNDKYVFATDVGLREFDLRTIKLEKSLAGGR